jgi:hypothetical protein
MLNNLAMAREFEHMGLPENARGHMRELRILFEDTMRLSNEGVTRLLRANMIDRFLRNKYVPDSPFFVHVQKRVPTKEHNYDTTVNIAFLHYPHVNLHEKFFGYTFAYKGDRLDGWSIDPSKLLLTGEQSTVIERIARVRHPEQQFKAHEMLNTIYFPERTSK